MSKGLEALECIKHKLSALEFVLGHDRIPKKAPYIQETIFHVIEKELKALEIIKEKNFDLFYLQDSKDLEMYNRACDVYRNLCYLTQEEYDLLKEVLL